MVGDAAELSSRLVCRQVQVSAAGHQLTQQLVEAVEQAGAFGGEIVAALREQPQNDGLVLGGDDAQPAMMVRDCLGHRLGVVGVGLAAPPVGEQPDAGAQSGWDVPLSPCACHLARVIRYVGNPFAVTAWPKRLG